MPTDKQIRANRRNALKSTGPNPPAGKALSALNARKHGLLTRDVLMPAEKAVELMAFREGMVGELAPRREGAAESEGESVEGGRVEGEKVAEAADQMGNG